MHWIDLPCAPHDSLDWTRELAAAKLLVEQGKRIVWKCNLGLESPFYPLDDEMRFQAATLAMSRFSEQVWPYFQESTDFICLYRGTADFLPFFSWSERQLTDFERFQEEEDQTTAKSSFAAESFAIYFQMLSHRLPDEAKVLLLFDVTQLPPICALKSLSKERFEHFSIGLRGMTLPIEGLRWNGETVAYHSIESNSGAIFPKAPCERLSELVTLPGVKIIFEQFVSEEWEGLDQLYVIAGSLSPQGMRKLSGFSAAGGEIIEI
jgi:hypothetical protein